MAKICYTDASTTVAPVAQLDRATGFEAPDNHRIASRIVLFLSISSRRTADRRLWRRRFQPLWRNMAKPDSV